VIDADFADVYFAFLLSGRAEDFRAASEAFDAALRRGTSMELLQSRMDQSHASAEMLCLIADQVQGTGTD
jgi:hypothetical protein